MRFVLTALLLGLFALPATAQTADLPPSRAGDVEPAAPYAPLLTDILGDVVTADGRVRYYHLRGARRDTFRRVLKAIETFDAATLTTQDERLAFWINAYNVQMLQHIIETPDVDHIIEDGYSEAFFQTPVRTAGLALTLDEIEHVMLRQRAAADTLEALAAPRLDPRIHVALNCAALGCPPLQPEAFVPERIDAQLEAAFRAFVNSPQHIRLDGDTLVLSSLLDWFGSDFDHDGQPAGDYLLAHMGAGRPDYAALRERLSGRTSAGLRALPTTRYVYDWAVNRAPR